ncbi:MAG TPA: bifunctional phosphopantothenoylcysteine decarboxylase/phosphopantothenate--cysteine ligase CoaBC [candidate division WOR-3 bacterium]|uniref:Coenzyme A biosynthesis bifunctional protein CoaBC n=1 Tax=candidate division WOR-3 bacterium TaxID=2052148 RepID=A0A7V0XFC9_UNCW3|nr:bifunctional phosphopantothenoylcysteine decarboxylase/phosphopantothenate--cysteine ligase CoaBC [candidate division WOR-3 bacterium]
MRRSPKTGGTPPATRPRRLLLGVTGGIAAYKTLEVVRRFRRLNWEVQVVMTASARRLLGPESFTALAGRPVAHELFPKKRLVTKDSASPHTAFSHIDLARWADVVLVAPATANCLGKLAAGIADDLLSTLLLAVPIETVRNGRALIAPAMNSRMWEHPSVRRNTALLREQGYVIVTPARGELACGDTGPGRLADVEDLAGAVTAAAEASARLPDLAGTRVVVTAGRTEEPLDPVRVLTNRSSGRLGVALARVFRLAGADVRLVCGAVSVPLPASIPATPAPTADAMLVAVTDAAADCDILVMCAAVGDYRPASVSRNKTHATRLTLVLEKTPDILKAVTASKRPPVVIGFSHDPSVAAAREKLRRKRLDLVVANPFETAGADTIGATLVPARGRTTRLSARSKESFARRLAAEAARLLAAARD